MPTADQNLWISRVLGVDLPAQPGAGHALNDNFAKARQVWVAARQKTDDSVSKLKSAVVDSYAKRGLGPKLAAAYEKEIAWVLTALDERVSEALDALVAARDGNQTSGLVADAREAIDDYNVFLSTDPIIDGLDHNPFGVAVGIRSTLSPTLTALRKVLA
jgi:hypothetical protein